MVHCTTFYFSKYILTYLLTLYVSNIFNDIANKMILESTINYIRGTKRFDNLEAFST